MDSRGRETTQLEHLGEIEKRLWTGADTLRANSNFASNEYFLPVMGLIFLRHAYSRFLRVKAEIEGSLPSRGREAPRTHEGGLLASRVRPFARQRCGCGTPMSHKSDNPQLKIEYQGLWLIPPFA
jgi:hypothetical protein